MMTETHTRIWDYTDDSGGYWLAGGHNGTVCFTAPDEGIQTLSATEARAIRTILSSAIEDAGTPPFGEIPGQQSLLT